MGFPRTVRLISAPAGTSPVLGANIFTAIKSIPHSGSLKCEERIYQPSQGKGKNKNLLINPGENNIETAIEFLKEVELKRQRPISSWGNKKRM